MAEIKLLKLEATTQLPQEMDSAADDITLNTFSVQGGGPVLGTTGLDMNTQAISDSGDLSFTDPSVNTITLTSGAAIVDDFMIKDRENLMTTAGSVSFPVITDVAGEVDAFRLPALAGVPTASPTSGGEGHLVWDSAGESMYVWNGSFWDNLNTVGALENLYIAGAGGIAANDAVYISAADTVLKAAASSDAAAACIGFASAAAIATASVPVVSEGLLAGFSGLTAGARYYLSATAGAVVATPPTGSGNNVVQVGFAKSATKLQLQIQYLGKKAV